MITRWVPLALVLSLSSTCTRAKAPPEIDPTHPEITDPPAEAPRTVPILTDDVDSVFGRAGYVDQSPDQLLDSRSPFHHPWDPPQRSRFRRAPIPRLHEGLASVREARLRDAGPTDVDGPRDPSDLMVELRARSGAIRGCYADALRIHPSVGGRIQVHFKVLRSGKVKRADVEHDAVGDPDLSECIVTRAMTWRLPRAAGATEFSWSFVLFSDSP